MTGFSTARRDPYDGHAAGYAEHLGPTLRGMAERLAELAGARQGERLLDLATGTGTGARAAASVGASVVGVDRSPEMVAIARERSPELDFRLADAYALPFDPRTFDAVTCGLSLSHFANPHQALTEVLRVLRPGARFVASAWGEGSSFPTGAISQLLDRYRVPAASIALDEATWLNPERGIPVLRRAGFVNVSVDHDSFTGRFANGDEAVAWSLAWPLTASRLTGLHPGGRERLLAEALQALEGADLSWRFTFNFYLGRAPKPG